MKIFIVNGYAGVGKTTYENLISVAAQEKNLKIGITSIINYVKDVATSLGWCGTKENKDRLMLCQLKDLLTEWNDSPYVSVVNDVLAYEEEGYDVLFIDMREAKDIRRFKKDFPDTKAMLVVRGEPHVVGNRADDNVCEYTYDIYIDNRGNLEDLKVKAEDFINRYIKEN